MSKSSFCQILICTLENSASLQVAPALKKMVPLEVSRIPLVKKMDFHSLLETIDLLTECTTFSVFYFISVIQFIAHSSYKQAQGGVHLDSNNRNLESPLQEINLVILCF